MATCNTHMIGRDRYLAEAEEEMRSLDAQIIRLSQVSVCECECVRSCACVCL